MDRTEITDSLIQELPPFPLVCSNTKDGHVVIKSTKIQCLTYTNSKLFLILETYRNIENAQAASALIQHYVVCRFYLLHFVSYSLRCDLNHYLYSKPFI
jgi:hypothetical protein